MRKLFTTSVHDAIVRRRGEIRGVELKIEIRSTLEKFTSSTEMNTVGDLKVESPTLINQSVSGFLCE